MRRRSFIACTGASLSLGGCVGEEPDDRPDRTEATGPDASDDSDTVRPTDVAVDIVTFRATPDLRVSTEVRRDPDGDRPAELVARLTNTGQTTKALTFGPTAPFSGYRGEHVQGGAKAYLVPEDRERVELSHARSETQTNAVPDEPIDGCWQLKGIWWDPYTEAAELEPNESVEQPYQFFGDAADPECLPSGRYRFVDRHLLDSSAVWSLDVILRR